MESDVRELLCSSCVRNGHPGPCILLAKQNDKYGVAELKLTLKK